MVFSLFVCLLMGHWFTLVNLRIQGMALLKLQFMFTPTCLSGARARPQNQRSIMLSSSAMGNLPFSQPKPVRLVIFLFNSVPACI